MLPKEELKQRNTEFWTGFQKAMRKHSSSNGRKMNWINYPTDVKDVYVRMESDGQGTRLCLDIQPKNDGVRSILWEQMTELKKVMDDAMGMEAIWIEESHHYNDRLISRIKWEDQSLNFYNDEQLEAITDFLSDKLIKFDAFYQEYKEILINLAS